MRNRADRYLFLATLGLLVVLPGLAAAGERVSPERAAAVLPPQARCAACVSAQKRCSATCFGRDDEAGLGACLTACDNAAATCSCEDGVTLRSEDIVAARPELIENLTGTCHSTTSCQPAYPSCASWSPYSPCDEFCGTGNRCGLGCPNPGFCPGPATIDRVERFRVCFDQFGNSCTEWQVTTLTFCGC